MLYVFYLGYVSLNLLSLLPNANVEPPLWIIKLISYYLKPQRCENFVKQHQLGIEIA